MRLTAAIAAAFLIAGCSGGGDTPVAQMPAEDTVLDDTTLDGAVLFDNVSLLTMAPGETAAAPAMDVLVIGGEIAEIAPDIDAPAGTAIVDGTGRTLMPGLIDMHVHVWDETELNAYLAHGVTTVRNMSGMPLHLRLAQAIEAGEIAGPRLITTGPILNSPGPNAQINHQIVTTAEEARAAVRGQYDQGYRILKVYSNLTRPAYEAILEEADLLGMEITGHTPEGAREDGMPFDKPFNIAFEEILDHGFTTIEHMESIVWHGLRDDPDPEKARALAREIAAANVTVDPTLIAHHSLQMMAETDGAWNERPESGMINPLLLEVDAETYAFWASQPADLRRAFDDFYAQAVKIFHEEGVTMVTGTDAGIFTNIPGSALTRELELMTGAGIPAHDVLVMATANGAAVLGLGETVGRIAPGYRAELILVDGDPLADISVVEHPAGVMAGGTWYDEAALAALHEAAFAHDPARTMARFEEAMAAQQVPQD